MKFTQEWSFSHRV